MVLLVTLVMLMIDIDLVGVMLIFGLELNSITAINLVMAVGLVVDYSAHIVHNFTLQNPELTRDERTINTLVEIGPSVRTHTHARARTHTHTHAHAHTRTHTRTHTHARARAHTNTGASWSHHDDTRACPVRAGQQ